MSKGITFILEPDVGKLTTEATECTTETLADLRSSLGPSRQVNCGKPLEEPGPRSQSIATVDPGNHSIWLYRIYHGSVVDGPGRRSVIQVTGCSIRCQGCYVPYTHERSAGKLVPISSIVQEIIANQANHDGLTILGGEPFDQAGSVAELIFRLRNIVTHIAVYSGYTVEKLIGRGDSNTNYILTHVDLLVDGPFISELISEVGEYRGSQNQRLIGS